MQTIKAFIHKPTKVIATQFVGGKESAEAIELWVQYMTDLGVVSDFVWVEVNKHLGRWVEHLLISRPGHITKVEVYDWLSIHSDGSFEVLSPRAFNKAYLEVEDSDGQSAPTMTANFDKTTLNLTSDDFINGVNIDVGSYKINIVVNSKRPENF